MPLFVVSVPSGRQVIVNAGSVAEAQQIGGSFVGGPAQARPATDADVRTIALLGPATKGDTRPAIESDPDFVASFGFPAGGATKKLEAPPGGDKGGGPPSGGGAAWYSINIPGAGVRLFWGPSLDAARLGAYTDLTTKWGLSGDQVSSVLAGMTVAGGDGPRPGGAKSSELAWGPPQGFTFDDKGGGGSLGLGGGGGGQTGGGLPPLSNQRPSPDLFDALFRRGLGERLGVGPSDVGSSILGRSLLRNQGDVENVFGFQRSLAGFGQPGLPAERADPSAAFQEFARTISGGGLGTEAFNIFRTLIGAQEGPVPAVAETLRKQLAGLQPTSAIGDLPGRSSQQRAQDLVDLTLSALGSRVSPLALNMLNFPSGPELRARFIAETGGGPEQDFIKFLRENFPLASTIR